MRKQFMFIGALLALGLRAEPAPSAKEILDQVRLQQVVWPDPHGRFPWDPGYQYPPQAQPLLGRP